MSSHDPKNLQCRLTAAVNDYGMPDPETAERLCTCKPDSQPADANYTPLDELIVEAERDPEMKAEIAKARTELVRTLVQPADTNKIEWSEPDERGYWTRIKPADTDESTINSVVEVVRLALNIKDSENEAKLRTMQRSLEVAKQEKERLRERVIELEGFISSPELLRAATVIDLRAELATARDRAETAERELAGIIRPTIEAESDRANKAEIEAARLRGLLRDVPVITDPEYTPEIRELRRHANMEQSPLEYIKRIAAELEQEE